MPDPKRSQAAKKAWDTIRKKRQRQAVLQESAARKVKASAAAKKAWETRKKNEEQDEKERQEALAILDELAKNRQKPPETA